MGGKSLCAIANGKKGVYCWDHPGLRKEKGEKSLSDPKKGNDHFHLLGNDMEYSALSMGQDHVCAITKGPDFKVKCWGNNKNHESSVPPTLKLTKEATCNTEH